MTLIGQVMPIRSFTTHDGLPQIQVTSIFEDSRGLIWIGTKGGLAYFNGIKFTNISQQFLGDPTNTSVIGELPNGSLLFHKIRSSKLYSFDGAKVSEFCVDSIDNKIIVAFMSEYYLYFRYAKRSTNHIFKLNLLSNKKDSLKIDRDVFYTNSGKEFKLVNYNEIYIYENDKWRLLKKAAPDVSYNIYYANFNNPVILESSKKSNTTKVWDNNLTNYLFSFQRSKDGSIKKVQSFNDFTNIAFTDQNYIYFIKGRKIHKLYLNNQTLTGFLIDKNKNLWHASENGLQVFGFDGFEAIPLDVCKDAWAFCKTSDNKYYYSGYNQGLFKIDISSENGYKSKINNPKSINDQYYYTALERNNCLYFAHGNGVIKLKNGKATKIAGSLPSLALKYEKDKQSIYCATLGGFTVINRDDQVTVFNDEIFQNKYTTSILPLKDKVYLGSYYKFLVYDKNLKTYIDLTPKFDKFEYPSAISLENSGGDLIWVGTIKGLFLYDIKKETLTPILQNIIHRNVVAIKNIKNEILCVGTNNELIFIDLKSSDINKLDFKIFNHLNGFLGQEIAQNSLFLDHTDTLWIPSATFLSKIAKQDISFTENLGHVRFTSLNQHLIPWQHEDSLFLVQSPDLNFVYESYGFQRPNDMVFQFRINNGTWSEWLNKEYFALSDLPSGEYIIQLRAKHGSKAGTAAEVFDILNIELKLPFYKEPNFPFYALGLGIVFLLFTIIYFWYFRLYRIKTHERENRIKYLQIHTLQSQLNPHFVFNVLGTIQSLVVSDNKETANKYLISFSKLIRRFLDSTIKANSAMDSKGIEIEITLSEEIEMLKLYIEFEQLQYENKFEYNFDIEHQIDTSVFTIPPMILQPFIENAIKHGLMYQDHKGKLDVKFYLKEDTLVCEILDNGVGREKAAEIQASSIKLYKSRGIDLVMERINILNTLTYDIRLFTEDMTPSGTRVNVFFNHKK